MAKSIEEMIEVMNAYKNGKKIKQFTEMGKEWHEVTNPVWNWNESDYEVMEEPKYRPYNDTEEMIQDFCERFNVTRTKFDEPFIWVKNTEGFKRLITDISYVSIWLGNDDIGLDTLCDNYTYIDGSPCGKKE